MVRLLLGLALFGAATHVAAAHETWILRADLWGNPSFSTLDIEREGDALKATLDGEKVEIKRQSDGFLVTGANAAGSSSHYVLKQQADVLSGHADLPDPNNATLIARHAVTGWRVPERQGLSRTHDFRPTDYSNTWNPDRRPVLVVWPGDTIHTTTIDSGGVDEHGKTQALFGNPQTGPFFIAGAVPGDTLVVHIRRLKLNRDYADSLDDLVARATPASLFPGAKDLGKPVRWHLDLANGRAMPEKATGALANYSVPLKPMLGGMAVAPGFGTPALSTGDTGRYGGNMDFNEVVEGNTVYLPVQQPGALLYMGDAHALQGDGETSQYALETSMDVTVSVDLIKGRNVPMPRVESPTELMVLGQAGSLDDALKSATGGMAQWLQQDYGLTLSQTAQVFGSAIRYTVANLAGRSVGVAARIDKALLPARTAAAPEGVVWTAK